MSLADASGLILAAGVGKHTDNLIEELVGNREGKTHCKQWNSDDWGGYERVLPLEIEHYIGQDQTQRLERTHGIVRQQTGKVAPTTEQVWQSLAVDESDGALSGELFQLDLAAQSLQDHGGTTSRID